MFPAIEDIPTVELIAELNRRQPVQKPMRYLVWSDHDPNDSFEVEAKNVQDALFAALDELGWVLGQGFEDDEDDPEHEGLDNLDLWGNTPMT